MEEILNVGALGGLNDQDLEDAVIYHILNHGADGVRREAIYDRFNLDDITNEDCWLNFRCLKEDIPRLALALNLPDNIRTPAGYITTGIEGLCIALRRLAYPNRWKDLERLFGLSNKTLSGIGNHIIDLIYNNKGDLLFDLGELEWLDRNRLTTYAEAISAKGAPMQNCWGFIDGTARAICRPTLEQQKYYSGHKRFHALKYQSVICPDGMIVNLQGPYEGRRHDSAILRDSRLYEQLQVHMAFDDGMSFALYGDSGYGIRELLLTPFPNTNHVVNADERRAQQAFNFHMSVVRQCVEWGFAKVIKDFAFLDFKKNQKLLLQDLEAMYKTGVILSNCLNCLYQSETSHYFQVVPPTLEQYLGVA